MLVEAAHVFGHVVGAAAQGGQALQRQAVDHVLDQGRVIHSGSASDLLAQPALLDSLLGIAVPKD